MFFKCFAVLPLSIGLAITTSTVAQERIPQIETTNLSAATSATNDQAVASVSGPTDLKFGEMFKWPIGSRGLEPTEKLLSLDRRSVRVVGYMVEQETMHSFILAPLPLKLGDEDEGLADDIPPAAIFIHSTLPADVSVPYRPGLLEFTGILVVGGFPETDGRTALVRLIVDSTMSPEEIRHARKK